MLYDGAGVLHRRVGLGGLHDGAKQCVGVLWLPVIAGHLATAVVRDRFGNGGHVYFAKSRQDGVQQAFFVFDHNEKSCIMTKQFDAPAQGRLRIDGQTVGIQQHDGLEIGPPVRLYMSFSKEFQFVTNEFDAFAVTAFHRHDVRFHFSPIIVVYVLQEFVQQGAFSRFARTVKNDVGNFFGMNKIIQFGTY